MIAVMSDSWWTCIINFEDYGRLLALLVNSVLAAGLVGLVGGVIGVFVIQRDMAFAVHGISEMSFSGAAAALLFGWDVVAGSIAGAVVASLAIGILGVKARARNSVIGVLMPFGLGLGILFLALYPGRSANKFGLLTGQIVAVDDPQLGWLAAISVIVIVALLVIWRPLSFDSVDAEVAAARGVPTRTLNIVFMLLLACVVAASVQIIGALLVLALLITPAAAASQHTSHPIALPLLSVLFGLISSVGGTMIALGGSLPISPYITTISFVIFLICRFSRYRRHRELVER